MVLGNEERDNRNTFDKIRKEICQFLCDFFVCALTLLRFLDRLYDGNVCTP